MILDLQRFTREGKPHWDELDALVRRLERNPDGRLTLDESKRFHHLYQRASADLARVMTFAAEPAIRAHLETLVARAYGEIHRHRKTGARWSPWHWFASSFPQTFRRQGRAFLLACAVLVAGGAFGGAAVILDPDAKPALLPFDHLLGDPRDRVAEEEEEASGRAHRISGHHAQFAGQLMTHNIQVSILALALGMAWGFGTIVVTFYNGAILGAVCADYVATGETEFLVGWLLPHGSIEIPALLVAAQAGLVLGGALIGWGSREGLRERMRTIGPDLATLIGGAAVMLVWAGIVESFLSQYHEPVIPYPVKIVFGAIELCGLVAFLSLAGRRSRGEAHDQGRRLRPATV